MASYKFGILDSLAESSAVEFRALEGPETYPFLRYEWLRAFELSECVGSRSGWIPRHLVIREGIDLVAFCPAYIKLHSYGEFVFDQGWAQASEVQLGVPYYPKLVLGVPFTPATGPRVLFRRDLSAEQRSELFRVLAQALPEVLEEMNLSSVHVLFPDREQGNALAELGFIERLGVQYQFHSRGEQSFDDFLMGFRSKRRAAIRRERREVESAQLEIEVLTGEQLSGIDPALAYRLYLTTVDKYVWGKRYLTSAFFEKVMSDMPDSLHFVLAKRRGDVVAGAINLIGPTAIFGRYWGAFEELRFLHFEVCLYRGIQECIERGLSRFEAGAGGEHKHGRGLVPTLTRSLHFLRDARLSHAIADFCQREAEFLRKEVDAADLCEGTTPPASS